MAAPGDRSPQNRLEGPKTGFPDPGIHLGSKIQNTRPQALKLWLVNSFENILMSIRCVSERIAPSLGEPGPRRCVFAENLRIFQPVHTKTRYASPRAVFLGSFYAFRQVGIGLEADYFDPWPCQRARRARFPIFHHFSHFLSIIAHSLRSEFKNSGRIVTARVDLLRSRCPSTLI